MLNLFQSVGCDHELGSGARFDRCRVCDGNGTSCVHVTGNFTEQWNKLGESYLTYHGRFKVRQKDFCYKFVIRKMNAKKE